MIMSTQYLFGIDPSELENKFYFDALQYKLDSAKKLFRNLLSIPRPTKEESDRMFWIAKAMRHTEKLLEDRDVT